MLSYSQNGYSDDFLMYDLNPGGLLVVLVIRNCVNSMKVKMETARTIEEDGCEIDVWGARLKVSLRLSPRRIVCHC